MGPIDALAARGLFGRLGASLKGLFAGGVLLLLAVCLQFWNEGRTVRRDAALAEGRAAVVAVSADAPQARHEGRLVHVAGEARAASPVADPAFGVSEPALALRRRVEMYQWHEKKQRRKETTSGGGTREVVTYRYDTGWSDEAIDSSRFHQPGPHVNPGALPYASETWRAGEVLVGGFRLAPEAVRELGRWERIAPTSVVLPPNLAASFRPQGDWLGSSVDAQRPEVGDVRVRFERVPEGPVSVVAQQRDGSLGTWTTSSGAELLLVEERRAQADALFQAAAGRNSSAAWALRIGGFVLGWIGFGILLGPLSVLAGALPLVGRVAGFGIALAAASLSALLSIVVIGSGWLWHRPWLLGLMVMAVVGLVVWLVRTRRATALPPPPPSAMPPPPPPASA